MQKIVNVLALASFAISGAVVGSGLYVYLNRASIIDGVKSKVMESVMGSMGGLGGMGGGALPIGTPDLASPADQANAPAAVPPVGGGLGIPNF